MENRLVKRTEFNQQHGEHEQKRHEQDEQEVAERFLLLLIKPPYSTVPGGSQAA